MLRHAENCMGDVEDENGAPTPKKGRRGRKKKMQSRKDDDDDETGSFKHTSVGPVGIWAKNRPVCVDMKPCPLRARAGGHGRR